MKTEKTCVVCGRICIRPERSRVTFCPECRQLPLYPRLLMRIYKGSWRGLPPEKLAALIKDFMARQRNIMKTCVVCGKSYKGSIAKKLVNMCPQCYKSRRGRNLAAYLYKHIGMGLPPEQVGMLADEYLSRDERGWLKICLICGKSYYSFQPDTVCDFCASCRGGRTARRIRRKVVYARHKGMPFGKRRELAREVAELEKAHAFDETCILCGKSYHRFHWNSPAKICGACRTSPQARSIYALMKKGRAGGFDYARLVAMAKEEAARLKGEAPDD